MQDIVSGHENDQDAQVKELEELEEYMNELVKKEEEARQEALDYQGLVKELEEELDTLKKEREAERGRGM